MSRRNDVTGAELVTKANTKEYAEGYERVFGAKKVEAPQTKTVTINGVPHDLGSKTSLSHEQVLKLMGRDKAFVTYRRLGYDVNLGPGESVGVYDGMKFAVKDKPW